jgi:hypothetical protein
MTAIDYDTEFLEDGRTIDLISIGMVRDDGTTYYAVVQDVQLISRAFQHPWLREYVLPSLPVRVLGWDGSLWTGDPTHPDHACVKPRDVIATEVAEFITSTPDPQLWAWYAAYDHVVLSQLFGRMIDLPAGVPMWTNDLKQEADRLCNPALPSLPTIDEHHALDDARECQYRRRWLADHAAEL